MMMLSVWATPEPWTGIPVGLVPSVSGPSRTRVVWAPGVSVMVPALKESELLVPPPTAQPLGDDVIVQGALHAGAVFAPVLVPAKVTVHVEGVHVIVLVPVFLMVMANAAGLAVADVPPVSETATTWTEELVVAEPIRPKMVAVTIPPTARTAAMMMNRSRLCEIPERLLIFITD